MGIGSSGTLSPPHKLIFVFLPPFSNVLSEPSYWILSEGLCFHMSTFVRLLESKWFPWGKWLQGLGSLWFSE